MRDFCFLANRHPGGSSSSVEAITALFYGGIAELDFRMGTDRDHFVQSKGHAASPLMFVLWAQGLLDVPLEEALRYGSFGHRLPRMPQRDIRLGVELGTGALGQGLSFGGGLAIALRKRRIDRRVYVLLGDAECTEGQVWEAAMTAARLRLRNLVALVDANGSGSMIKLPRDEWRDRWVGFGWHTQVVDGHDVQSVRQALECAQAAEEPSAILLHTVKGRGLSAGFEGSDQLSSSVPAEAVPDTTSVHPIILARSVIEELMAGSVPPASAHPVSAARDVVGVAALMRSADPGSEESAKRVGGSIAEDLADLPLLFMAPDAIRNSGISSRMAATGAWSWDNPDSNVLELAIAEQDGVSLAAGVTAGGITALLFSMEAFYWRALDQIRQSVAFARIPAVLIGTSGGVGDLLGPMVQSDRLLAALQQIIGLEILEVADANQARCFLAAALCSDTPTYVRMPHESTPVLASLEEYLLRDADEGCWLRRDCGNPDVVLVTAGAMVHVSLRAAELISAQAGLECRVIEVFGVRRFAAVSEERRASLIPPAARRISVHNGPTSVLSPFLGAGGYAIGVDDWGMPGEDINELYRAYGLDVRSIVALAVKDR
jgi:transketolase